MEKRRQPEIIAGRVNSDGTIAAGDGFTVNKTAVGQYALTFAPGFRLVTITPTMGATLGGYAMPGLFADRSVQITTNNTANAATDLAFSFVATGIQQ